jgi:hypothetical protein
MMSAARPKWIDSNTEIGRPAGDALTPQFTPPLRQLPMEEAAGAPDLQPRRHHSFLLARRRMFVGPSLCMGHESMFT